MIADAKKLNWFSILNYFIYCFIGCISTIYCTAIGCNVIVASSIVGIILSVFAITLQDEHRLSWAGFAGSFAGMTAHFFISTADACFSWDFLIGASLLSLTVASLYSVSEIISFFFPKVFFDGYGGRLGFIAFISVLIFMLVRVMIQGRNFHLFDFDVMKIDFSPMMFLILLSSTAAAMISMEIKNAVSSLNDNYKVLSVAITGIIGGILVTKIPKVGMELGFAWYAGAFVGMSSYFILMLKRHFFFAGLFTGVIYIFSEPFFVGVGGKLGFISFLSVFLMRMIYLVANRIREGTATVDVASLKSGHVSNVSVDDNYAQKLVESLMKAKESGEDISDIDYQTEIGSFVIGEKEEYNDIRLEEETSTVVGYEYLDSRVKECVDFIQNTGGKKWVYLAKNGRVFNTLSFETVCLETLERCIFEEESKFIQLLEQEKRVIGFGKRGLEQPFFQNKLAKEDWEACQYLVILPLLSPQKKIDGFFFIFYEEMDIEAIQTHVRTVKQYYHAFVSAR